MLALTVPAVGLKLMRVLPAVVLAMIQSPTHPFCGVHPPTVPTAKTVRPDGEEVGANGTYCGKQKHVLSAASHAISTAVASLSLLWTSYALRSKDEKVGGVARVPVSDPAGT